MSEDSSFIRREGPARERQTGFIQEVLSVFRPALASFGYRLISANAFFVRFESRRMFCEVSHDRLNYIVDIGIGELPYRLGVPKYTLSNLVHFLKIQAGDFTLPASNEKQVHERVRQIADLIEKRLSNALAGDPAFFPRLKKALSSENLAVVSNPALDEWVGGLHLESRSSQQERAYGLLQEVLAAFPPILSPLGYHLIDADAFIVRFESDSMYFLVEHDYPSAHIDVDIGKQPYSNPPQRYGLWEIMEFFDIPPVRTYRAANRDEVRDMAGWMSQFLQEYCLDILRGDEELLGKLDHFLLPERRRYNYRARHGEDPPEGWDPYSENWWI